MIQVNLKKIGKMIRMTKVFNGHVGRWRTLTWNSELRPNKFRAFVNFVHNNFGERDPITPRVVVKMEDCPVRDEETAGKYLRLMQRERLLHLKSLYTHGKVYFKGCTPAEEVAFKRMGFEGWLGIKVTGFLRRHPLVGRLILQRIYRFQEYGEPLLRARLATQLFPHV